MEQDIIFRGDLKGIDWDQLKAVLAKDNFDNGRTPDQLRRSFTNSYAAVVVHGKEQIIGTARALSDGVCNAYIVDVWTYSPYRNQGIARKMLDNLLAQLPGQHVYLFTDDLPEFYQKLGFVERGIGMEILVGRWLES